MKIIAQLAKVPHALGAVASGEQSGEMGNTGKSAGGAINLHPEGFHGRFQVSLRTFTSLTEIKRLSTLPLFVAGFS